MYPIILTGKLQAVVVGGGIVGERKVKGLLAAGADVTVVSPDVTAQLQNWVDEGRIKWKARPYRIGDLAGALLAYAATDQRGVNQQVAFDAHSMGILCNVCDASEEGDFHVPAVQRSVDMLVTVSTFGKNPARARDLRDRIAAWLESEEEA